MPSRKTLILAGWDGADWLIARPLMDKGRMPQLAQIVRNGCSGPVESLPPFLSPMLWTTISTGKHPAEHGIVGFTENNVLTHAVQPASSRSRRCKALWNILSQEGLRCHVVGWFSSHPAERVNGACVADTFGKFMHGRAEEEAPAGSVNPESALKRLAGLRVPPLSVDPAILKFFIPLVAEINPKRDPRPRKLLEHLSELYSVHNAAVALLADGPCDFLAVYYHFIDWISHDFIEYAPPRRPEVSERDFALYSGVLDAAYALQDLLLRDLLAAVGGEASCIVVSDHGFRSGDERPARTPGMTAGIAAWHRMEGVLAMAGGRFEKGVGLRDATLFDIAPTVLNAFGLPAGADMPGRVLSEAFAVRDAPKRIDSWDMRGPSLQESFASAQGGDDSAALLRQFEALGYISLRDSTFNTPQVLTECENEWNLGVSLLCCKRTAEALEHLEAAWMGNPSQPNVAMQLARCQAALGLHDEAAALARTVLDYGPDNADADLFMAELALAKGDCPLAMSWLGRAENAAGLTVPPIKIGLQRGLVLLHMERFAEAERVFGDIRERTGMPEAALGLARALVRQAKGAEAEPLCRELLAVHPRNATAWFTLGQALEEQGRSDEAGRAFAETLAIEPNFVAARAKMDASARGGTGQSGRFEPVVFEGWDFSTDFQERRAREDAKRVAALRVQVAERMRIRRERRDLARAASGPMLLLRRPAQAGGAAGAAFVTVVSGLPRSGTSMMMQMLARGGMELLTDDARPPDAHNPRGYCEWEPAKRLEDNPGAIAEAAGRAVKVVSAQIRHLPTVFRYNIVWMDRPTDEIAASQARMIRALRPGEVKPLDEGEAVLNRHRDAVLGALRKLSIEMPDRLRLIEVSYGECLCAPELAAARVAAFLGTLVRFPLEMPRAVEPGLNHAVYARAATATEKGER